VVAVDPRFADSLPFGKLRSSINRAPFGVAIIGPLLYAGKITQGDKALKGLATIR
jgi:hypothetical protein